MATKKVRVEFNLTLEDRVEGDKRALSHKAMREILKSIIEQSWDYRQAKITSLNIDNILIVPPFTKKKNSNPVIAMFETVKEKTEEFFGTMVPAKQVDEAEVEAAFKNSSKI